MLNRDIHLNPPSAITAATCGTGLHVCCTCCTDPWGRPVSRR